LDRLVPVVLVPQPDLLEVPLFFLVSVRQVEVAAVTEETMLQLLAVQAAVRHGRLQREHTQEKRETHQALHHHKEMLADLERKVLAAIIQWAVVVEPRPLVEMEIQLQKYLGTVETVLHPQLLVQA
jgi:hypothetical protein